MNHRRTLLLLLVVGIAASCGINQKEFEPLYRAGKDISGATEVGVTLLRYRELLQALATEIKVAEDKASSAKEVAFVSAYKDALVAFRDAETMWRAKIDLASVTPRGEPARIILAGPSEEFFGALVDKYKLRLSVDAENKITIDEMQQEMWKAGGNSLAAGEAIYNR